MSEDTAPDPVHISASPAPAVAFAGIDAGAASLPADRERADLVDDEDLVPDPQIGSRRWLLTVAAVVLVLGSLVGPISASGIWEPPELKGAELARRIAVALLGAKNLIIDGSINTVPTAGQIGRGELPFTSIALGLKVFGLSEWAGRLPMALWGLLGVAATYLLLSRLVDRVAAAFAAIVLATTPLYFLQARTILGDIVTMSGLAIAVAGLAIASFDTRPRPRARVAYWIFGLAGCAAGFGARGVILGIALPCFSIGLAWLLRRGAPGVDRLSAIFAILDLVLGAAALVLGLRALLHAEDHQFLRILGCTIDNRRTIPTHDFMVLQLGHAMFPWSAVAPFALGRALRAPIGVEGDAFARESSARILLLVTCVLAFAAFTALAPSVGVLPFSAVFALAGVIAILLRDFERGAPGSRTLALGVASLLILFLVDFKNFPEKGLAGFVVDDARFPDSFKDLGLKIVEVGTLVGAGLFVLSFFERDEGRPVFAREEHRRFTRELRAANGGNVVFGLAAIEVSLIVLSAALAVSQHFTHWRQLDSIGSPGREAAEYGLLVLPVLVALPHVILLLRDACRVVLRWLHTTRASASLMAIAALGATLSFRYYPLLARQISPKEVFESFKRLSRPGEDLSMVGSGAGSGSARYYAHRDVRNFMNSSEAFTWLMAGGDSERRWLVVRSTDLAQMNSEYRARRTTPPKNLPVLDARSSEILLVSNLIRAGEKNENPFLKWVLDTRPPTPRPLDADFNGQLHAFGWGVTTPDGEPVTWVRAGKPYVFHFYYEVTHAIAGEWQTFIHVDGYQRRYNGDHETLEGKYPFRWWHPGDFIHDSHPFELEPNFSAGTYTVFFGLFRGEQRLDVKRGGGEDNRVNAGPLEVR